MFLSQIKRRKRKKKRHFHFNYGMSSILKSTLVPGVKCEKSHLELIRYEFSSVFFMCARTQECVICLPFHQQLARRQTAHTTVLIAVHEHDLGAEGSL